MVQEVEDILQKIGLVMDNIKMMQMHFYFLLIIKQNILLIMETHQMLFIVEVIYYVHLEMDMI